MLNFPGFQPRAHSGFFFELLKLIKTPLPKLIFKILLKQKYGKFELFLGQWIQVKLRLHEEWQLLLEQIVRIKFEEEAVGVKSEPTVGLAVRIKTIISEDWVDFLREFINLVQSSFLASNILDFFTRFVTPIVKEKLKICLNNSVFS